MRARARAAVAVGVALVAAVVGISPAAAEDGVSAEDLESRKEVIFANVPTRMWECWEEGASGAPRLYQRVAGKWRLLDVATTERDVATCGRRTPIKAVYEFTLFPVGRLNTAEDYYETRVLTKCSGCQTYRWTIPFRNTDEIF